MSTVTKPAPNTNVLLALLHPINGFSLVEGSLNRDLTWCTTAGILQDTAVTGWVALTSVRGLTFTH